jgi:signal transduction histidine kinase
MIPRFLNLQGMIGIAAALLLLSLFLVKAGEARHWRKQSGRYEQLYLAEQGARAQTIANYRAAAETARKEDLANANRVAAEQRTISERISHDLEARLADARARAQRLQLGQGSPAATGGSGRAAAVPAARAAPPRGWSCRRRKRISCLRPPPGDRAGDPARRADQMGDGAGGG